MQLNLSSQFTTDEETWPPYQLQIFIPLLLLHYKSQRNIKQAHAMAKLTSAGDIDDIPSMASDQLIPMHYSKQLR